VGCNIVCGVKGTRTGSGEKGRVAVNTACIGETVGDIGSGDDSKPRERKILSTGANLGKTDHNDVTFQERGRVEIAKG